MTHYFLTDAGRLVKLEDDLAIAELSNCFWVPLKEIDEQVGVCKRMSEKDVTKFTFIPGDVVTKDNVAPLWEFTNEVFNLAVSLFGSLKGYLMRNVVDGPLSPKLSEDVIMECLIASFVLNRAIALTKGYESFGKIVAPAFLNYYAYQAAMNLSGGMIASRKEYVERFLSCISDYEDASTDESRVEQVYKDAWQSTIKTDFKDRILLCLSSRCYLRAKGVSEEKFPNKESKEIPDFTLGDSREYLAFSLAFLKVASCCIAKGLPDKLPLDDSRQA